MASDIESGEEANISKRSFKRSRRVMEGDKSINKSTSKKNDNTMADLEDDIDAIKRHKREEQHNKML